MECLPMDMGIRSNKDMECLQLVMVRSSITLRPRMERCLRAMVLPRLLDTEPCHRDMALRLLLLLMVLRRLLMVLPLPLMVLPLPLMARQRLRMELLHPLMAQPLHLLLTALPRPLTEPCHKATEPQLPLPPTAPLPRPLTVQPSKDTPHQRNPPIQS